MRYVDRSQASRGVSCNAVDKWYVRFGDVLGRGSGRTRGRVTEVGAAELFRSASVRGLPAVLDEVGSVNRVGGEHDCSAPTLAIAAAR